MFDDVSAIFIDSEDSSILDFCNKYGIPIYENIFGYHIYQIDLFFFWLNNYSLFNSSDRSIFNDLLARI